MATRPFIPYKDSAFLKSKATNAPIDQARTAKFKQFMSSFGDQKKWKYPSLQGLGTNKWGTVFAMAYSSDPIWKLSGPGIDPKVKTQLCTTGFHAPTWLGQALTGTSDSPFCVIDTASNITVFGTKASASGKTIKVQSGACFWHDSNGLDGRNTKADNKNNRSSRGRISEALVIRKDMVDYGISNNTDLGYVLHLFMAETNSADGHCHPMTGHESSKSGFGAEGERVVIRPDVNLASRGMSPGGLVIARTLQNYGCIIGDNAGGQSTLKVEQERGGSIWKGVLSQDSLKGITWDDFACVTRGWQ